MPQALPVCAVLAVLPFFSRAGERPAPTETVVRLEVTPAPAPNPALKYQLLPELREINPGNPCKAYLMCFMEQDNFWSSKEAVVNREKWEMMPLKDLPVKEMRNSGYGKRGALGQADYAARLDTPDWQVLLKLKKEGINFHVPDVQYLRRVGWALKVRFRCDLAEKNYEEALETAKTMFALARHFIDHPCLIPQLVGMAIGNMALDPLEEMLQQPGCPNLFWALTDLPQPFIDLRKAIQGDRITAEAIFSLIEGKEIMSETKLQEAIKRFCPEGEPSGQNYDGELLKARAANQEIVEAARGRLIENGLSGRMFKQFHPLQVILLDEKYLFEKEFDEATKALNLPFWQYEVVQVGRHLPPRPEERKPSWRGWTYFHKVKMAQVRLEQRLALLRCIEALRLYAAEHGGQLPAQLADIKLPLPVDPVTGQPFAYKLEGGVVKLRGTPPRGMEKNAAFNRRYEITIKK